MTQIVQVNVTEQVAPAPSTLQGTGAFISQGATNTAVNSRSLLTQLSDLTPLLMAPIPLASLSASSTTATGVAGTTAISSGSYGSASGLVSLTLDTTLGVQPGNLISVSGAVGSGSVSSIDGTWTVASVSGLTVTYTIATGLVMTITAGGTVGVAIVASGSFLTTIAGASPSGYNGTVKATVTNTLPLTFTYTVPSGLSTPATGTPTFTVPNQSELVAMATTFFNQGSNQAVYVLELGPGTAATGVTTLAAYITANPGFFYSYLVPRYWDSDATFLAFLAGFEEPTSKTYFHVTTKLTTYSNYTTLMKCVIPWIEAPTIPTTEFTAAAFFWVTLHYAPSTTNKITPASYSYLFGVTPYPIVGNSALFATLKAASINIVGTGSEGGISTAITLYGTTKDGNDFTFWYSVDWIQIYIDLNLSNAIINGSNNPINPLYYNQPGINRLSQVAYTTLTSAVTFGLLLNPPVAVRLDGPVLAQNLDNGTYTGQTVLNSVPFINYVAENPSDYPIGRYAGMSVSQYTPTRGFITIVFNVQISSFAAG